MAKQPKYVFGLLETPAEVSGQGYEASSDTVIHQGASSSSISSDPSLNRTSTSTNLSRMGSVAQRQFGSARSSSTSGSARQQTRTPQGSRYTSHTSSLSTPAANGSTVIVAVVEGRGLAKGEVGMASIDLKHPLLILSQFADNQTYAKLMTRLNILQPLEIVMPSTAYETGNTSKLLDKITNEFPRVAIHTVNRKYFNEEKGMQYIKSLCLPEYSTVEITVRSKYYCLSTVSALLKYIEFIQHVVYAPSSLKIVFKGSEQTTMIDVTTVSNLELLRNIRDPRSEHTLYGILNSTKTRMGARLLRSNILQPPCDVETINTRLDVVQELTQTEDLFQGIRAVLSRFLDVDHLLSMCVQVPKEETLKTTDNWITTVIYLKHTLEEVEALRMVLCATETDNELLKSYQAILSDARLNSMLKRIGEVIHDDTRYLKGALGMRTQKCFAVKPGINGLLDVARRTYNEIIDDISELIKQTSEKYGLRLRMSYNTVRGFHIQLCSTGKDGYSTDNLPDEFIKVTKCKNVFSFTTADLIKMNDRVKESLNEIYIMSGKVLSEFMVELRQQMICLYELANCIAVLDMLTAFAHVCTLNSYMRPEFADTLAVKHGKHPIMDRISLEPLVPNSVFASNERNFVIITGPNMSGKSTYLRQIALTQIMAQIGSFVPAEYASIRIADQIFSRIGSDDDIETNSSTFSLEMREISYIIQNATASSLIIVDELGRGTSTEEGYAICHAVCEHLQAIKAFTFFTTHFLELTSLEELYPNVENYHFEVQHSVSDDHQSDRIQYTHVMSRGRTQEKHYGIQLAEVSTLPCQVIDDAKQMCRQISDQQMSRVMTREMQYQRAVYKLGKQLQQTAVHSRLDADSLRTHVKSLKEEFLRDVSATNQSVLEE